MITRTEMSHFIGQSYVSVSFSGRAAKKWQLSDKGNGAAMFFLEYCNPRNLPLSSVPSLSSCSSSLSGSLQSWWNWCWKFYNHTVSFTTQQRQASLTFSVIFLFCPISLSHNKQRCPWFWNNSPAVFTCILANDLGFYFPFFRVNTQLEQKNQPSNGINIWFDFIIVYNVCNWLVIKPLLQEMEPFTYRAACRCGFGQSGPLWLSSPQERVWTV